MQQTANLNDALKHLDHVLTLQSNHIPAKLMKAQALTKLKSYESAYQVYDDLCEFSPNYYLQMVGLNKQLGREERNQPLYERTLASFQNLAAKEENQADDTRWIVVETGIANTFQLLNRHEESASRLQELITSYSADQKGGPRKVILEHLLSSTYASWAGKIAGPSTLESLPSESLQKIVDLSRKAYEINPKNIVALQTLTQLTFSSNAELVEKAKSVYDPTSDANPPTAVLVQLGNYALVGKEFSKAIRFYERARGNSPNDAAILNNLAFAYLAPEDNERHPERALQLINQSIQKLPKNLAPVEMSKFLHTKATALKQLERWQDALAVYERSLKGRPKHVDTLRSLIECYYALNKEPPKEYVTRLDELKNQPGQ